MIKLTNRTDPEWASSRKEANPGLDAGGQAVPSEEPGRLPGAPGGIYHGGSKRHLALAVLGIAHPTPGWVPTALAAA